jgi:proline utilization trans-activator
VRASDQEDCSNCTGAGTKCESTLPRKHRVYGSVESFGLRYRALDALVRGLFPNDDVDNVDALLRLGQARQISMPSPDTEASAPEGFLDAVRGATHGPDQSPTASASINYPALSTDAPEEGSNGPDAAILEERLIPAPHGVSHYVGPASSFEFANAIRRLVSKYNTVSSETRTRTSHRSQMRADWAKVPISRALENRNKDDATVYPSNSAHGSEAEDSSSSRSGTSEATPSHDRKRSFADLLPPRDQSDSLVRSFFDRVHPNYLLFHRGMFQVSYESLWHTKAGQAVEPELGWVCSLFMILVFGAQALEQKGLEEANKIQRRYLAMVRDEYQHLAFTATLANVQALLLLQLHEFNAGERNTAWMLLGQAARMAIALGMHREGSHGTFDALERNTRRMVFWTMYMFDHKVSSILGRPLTLDPKEVNTKLLDEQIIDGGDYPPGYMSNAMALTLISSRVKTFMSTVYKKHLYEAELSPTCDKAAHILQELSAWKAQLPQHLHPGWQFIFPRQHRAVLLLHVYYNHIKCVVTRPYLLAKINRDIERQSLVESPGAVPVNAAIASLSQDCRFAAKEAADNIQQLASNRLLEGVLWLDFFYLQHAMLVMSLAFLGQPHDNEQESVMDAAHRTAVTSLIRLCQTTKLAPTYSILCRVAISFAHIVGIDTEDVSSQDEDEQQRPQHTGRHLATDMVNSLPDQQLQQQFRYSQQPLMGPINALRQNESPNAVPEFFSDWYQFGPNMNMNLPSNDMPWDFFNMDFDNNEFYRDNGMQQLLTPFSGTFSDTSVMNEIQRQEWTG